jgi:hypothetical protein
VENQYAMGWGALALINAGLAQGKNRSGLNWFFTILIIRSIGNLDIAFRGKKASLLKWRTL